MASYDKQKQKGNERNNTRTLNWNLNHHWWYVRLLWSLLFFSHYYFWFAVCGRVVFTSTQTLSPIRTYTLHTPGLLVFFDCSVYPRWFYPLAWIAWAYHLTYTECLVGISNTGTRIRRPKRRRRRRQHHTRHPPDYPPRRTGTSSKSDATDEDNPTDTPDDPCCRWEGPLLKTNLDAVICLRYHTLLFKLSCMICGLCTFVILPINLTATCDPTIFGVGTCYQRHKSHPNNTGFFKLTTMYGSIDSVLILCFFFLSCCDDAILIPPVLSFLL